MNSSVLFAHFRDFFISSAFFIILSIPPSISSVSQPVSIPCAFRSRSAPTDMTSAKTARTPAFTKSIAAALPTTRSAAQYPAKSFPSRINPSIEDTPRPSLVITSPFLQSTGVRPSRATRAVSRSANSSYRHACSGLSPPCCNACRVYRKNGAFLKKHRFG